MAVSYPDEHPPASGGENPRPGLPHRGGAGPWARTEARAEARAELRAELRAEARAELRDRETYYAELRLAVHCQSRSVPAPRMTDDDAGSGTTWEEMIARFGDTWP